MKGESDQFFGRGEEREDDRYRNKSPNDRYYDKRPNEFFITFLVDDVVVNYSQARL